MIARRIFTVRFVDVELFRQLGQDIARYLNDQFLVLASASTASRSLLMKKVVKFVQGVIVQKSLSKPLPDPREAFNWI